MDRDASETFNNSDIEKQVAYYFTGKKTRFPSSVAVAV